MSPECTQFDIFKNAVTQWKKKSCPASSYGAVMANLFDPACQNLNFLRVPPLACHFLFLMVMD